MYVTALPLLRKVVWLVLNELRNKPQNEFLRLFASRQRVRKQTLDEVLQDPITLESEPLLAAVFGLQRMYQMENEAMTKELTVDDVMAIGDKLRKQAIASGTVKERLAGLAPEEVLAALTPEQMAELFEQLKALLGEQAPAQPKHRKPSTKR
ncbi:MAG: hypothetical protein IPK16_28115 [Anaerolineales bacterium]|nr:hypothetical protein [Anaerolineales bacterium]